MHQAMNSVGHGKSTPFEATFFCFSRYCSAARQGLVFLVVLLNLIRPADILSGFKRHATAVLTAVALQTLTVVLVKR